MGEVRLFRVLVGVLVTLLVVGFWWYRSVRAETDRLLRDWMECRTVSTVPWPSEQNTNC